MTPPPLPQGERGLYKVEVIQPFFHPRVICSILLLDQCRENIRKFFGKKGLLNPFTNYFQGFISFKLFIIDFFKYKKKETIYTQKKKHI